MKAPKRRAIACILAVAGMSLLATAWPSASGNRPGGADPPPGRTLRGEIVLKPPGTPFRGADLIVTVEDVTARDASARLLARKVFKDVWHEGREGTPLRFKLENLHPEPGRRYQVRILVDLDRNRRISKGDYRSVRSVPVFTKEDRDPLVIEAERKEE
jgi:hypothetical protein